MRNLKKRVLPDAVMRRLIRYWRRFRNAGPNLEDPFQVQNLLMRDTEHLTIFDVGAYVGNVTKIYRGMFPKATIYCFEPFPDSFEELSRLADGEHIKPYQIALCEAEGRVNLQVDSDQSCNSLFPRPTVGAKYYPGSSQNIGQIEVETQTLDTFCDSEGIGDIDILKVDVEGAELKVFEGASKRLRDKRIKLIYAEVMFVPHYKSGCLFHEVSGFLTQYGYTLFDLYGLKRAPNGQLRWGNAIFLDRELRRELELNLRAQQFVRDPKEAAGS